MSRLNTAAMMQPDQKQGNGRHEYPEIDIGAGDYRPPQQDQPQQQQPEGTGQEQYLKSISEQLAGMNNQQQQQFQQAYQQIAGDPVIQQYLQAKQQGKKLKLADAEEDPLAQINQQDDQDAALNWTELSQDPTKFADAIVKQTARGSVKQMIPLIQGMLSKQLAPVQQLGQVVQNLMTQVKQINEERVTNEVSNVRAKNPALFDELKPMMYQLSQQFPGMTTPDLFNFAMMKSGKTQQNAQQTQSERPNQQPNAQPNFRQQALAPQQGGMRSNPKLNFDAALSQLLDSKDFSNIG